MNNSAKVYLEKLEQEKEYYNLLYSVIEEIQNEIEKSIKKGDWYKKITYEIDANLYDEETIDRIMEDLYQNDGEDFKIEGFKVDMQFNNYSLDYYITVDTDVNCGHLDYNLMDELLANNYIENIEDVRRYIKVFNQYNTVISNDDEVIVIDNEQKVKVTFFVSGWFKWEHTTEIM